MDNVHGHHMGAAKISRDSYLVKAINYVSLMLMNQPKSHCKTNSFEGIYLLEKFIAKTLLKKIKFLD